MTRCARGIPIATVVAILLISGPVLAQPVPAPARVQIFGGYSHLLLEPREEGGHGVAAGLVVSLNRYVGFTFDVDSHTFSSRAREQDIRLTYLSGGPRVSLQFDRFTPFGFVTVDGQWSQYSTGRAFDQASMTYTPCCGGSGSAWGLGFGGGMDVRLTPRFAVRAIQWNQSLGGFGSGPGRETRLKAGFVIRMW